MDTKIFISIFRLYKYNIIAEDLGAFSSTVLSGFSPSPDYYIHLPFQPAANAANKPLDYGKYIHVIYL